MKTNWLTILKNHLIGIKGAGWTDENLKTIDSLLDALGTLVGAIDAATTDSLHGKLGTDTELADYSLYDLLGGNAFKTNALSAMLGAFTSAQNLKAILGNLTTTKNLGGVLGALTTTDNLKAILGAYTAAANLKAAIDAIPTVMVGTNGAALASAWTAALATALAAYTAVRGGYLDELGPTNIPADTDPKVMGRAQIKATTEDLQQAAGAKDLVTGTTQDVIVESLTLRCPVNCADDTGDFTGISIQTDDTTPQEIISIANGVKANLTQDAQLAWTGAILLKATKKIQLTIIGGPADEATVCDIVIKCRAVVSGGYLA